MKIKIEIGDGYNSQASVDISIPQNWKTLEPNRHKLTAYLAEELKRIERDLLDLIKPE